MLISELIRFSKGHAPRNSVDLFVFGHNLQIMRILNQHPIDLSLLHDAVLHLLQLTELRKHLLLPLLASRCLAILGKYLILAGLIQGESHFAIEALMQVAWVVVLLQLVDLQAIC